MTVDQIRKAEEVVLDVISKDPEVFYSEAPLPLAKEVQGLRAMFDEVRCGWDWRVEHWQVDKAEGTCVTDCCQ